MIAVTILLIGVIVTQSTYVRGLFTIAPVLEKTLIGLLLYAIAAICISAWGVSNGTMTPMIWLTNVGIAIAAAPVPIQIGKDATENPLMAIAGAAGLAAMLYGSWALTNMLTEAIK